MQIAQNINVFTYKLQKKTKKWNKIKCKIYNPLSTTKRKKFTKKQLTIVNNCGNIKLQKQVSKNYYLLETFKSRD